MALSDLAVFSEYAYSTMTEVLAQQVDIFNEASRGAIQLQSAAHQGDYSEKAFFAKIQGLVRRRNAYGSGAVTGKVLQHLVDTMVKVASGTPPISIDPGQFEWIQQNPEVAGATIGQQLAKDSMADMLNTGLLAGRAALAGQSAIVTDITAGEDGADLIGAGTLNTATGKFGDRSADIVAWVMHSKAVNDFYGAAIANANGLFTYGTINVVADPFGRVFVVTDSPALITTGTPNTYWSMGLTPGGIAIDQNNDFTDNVDTKNGDENILRTYQAEWSYNIGVKGFAWDKTNGGKSPNDTALGTGTNWDKYATSHKDLAGVLVKSH